MKKFAALFLSLALLLMVTACQKTPAADASDLSPASEAPQSQATPTEEKSLKIVSTIYPGYDWAKELLKGYQGKVELTYLLDDGVDLHSYQPTAEDLAKISDADLFIHVGGHSDAWVKKALETATNPDREVLNLMEVLGDQAKVEELVQGMEDHDDHDHDHEHEEADHDHDHDHEDADHDHGHEEADHDHGHEEAANAEAPHVHQHGDEVVYDEHVWLSLKNAKQFVEALAQDLGDLNKGDADFQSLLTKNKEAYTKELDALDGKFQDLLSKVQSPYLIFADRFPFRYFVDDYKIPYSAAFSGCSADTQASFETIVFLAKQMDKFQIHDLFILERSDDSVAKAVIENSQAKDAKIHILNSMQSITSQDLDSKLSYLSTMEENYQTLQEVLH